MITVPPHIKGLVFDLDGTLADTMPAHYKAWVAALATHGVAFPETLFYEFGGIPTPQIIEILNKRFHHNMPVMETAHYKEQLFEQSLTAVTPVEPVVAVVEQFHGKIPLAVATGGMRHIATRTLNILKLFDRFNALVTADDVQHGKPAPDVFLEAARRIGVDPKLCMAFEDATPGVEAATAAGMMVFDVRTLFGKAP
ncbi:MAG TPA: beta-phosphoglucomutase family hydrolase [Tepidisphaeraceae bacterium]|jgi:beta-phosphoglucomutase family hydrolase